MSKQRTKGTQFESLILEGIQAYIPDAHRLGMQGAKDCGDIWLAIGDINVVPELRPGMKSDALHGCVRLGQTSVP